MIYEQRMGRAEQGYAAKDKKEGYFAKLRREMKKVVWPGAGKVAKYSFAVILFCVILVAFFIGIDALASLIKGLF